MNCEAYQLCCGERQDSELQLTFNIEQDNCSFDAPEFVDLPTKLIVKVGNTNTLQKDIPPILVSNEPDCAKCTNGCHAIDEMSLSGGSSARTTSSTGTEYMNLPTTQCACETAALAKFFEEDDRTDYMDLPTIQTEAMAIISEDYEGIKLVLP